MWLSARAACPKCYVRWHMQCIHSAHDGKVHAGPFIKLGPLRNVGAGVAERAGCLSGAGLVVILSVALTIYGAAAFQVDQVPMGVKTLSGRELQKDPLQVTYPPLQDPQQSSTFPPSVWCISFLFMRSSSSSAGSHEAGKAS